MGNNPILAGSKLPPIIASASSRLISPAATFFLMPFISPSDRAWLAVTVGHNPNAVSAVRGINGASWNNKWDGLIPDAFQVRKAALEAQRLVNKASDIFANDPLRP